MNQRASNEGKVLDAVIQRIEARDGVNRTDMRDPEAEKHRAPVDQVCTFGNVLYAFEHTEIEPFPDHIEIQKHNEELLGPIPAALADLPGPTECYQLHVPIDASVGIKRAEHHRVRGSIIDWVRQEAPGLQARPYGSPGKLIAVQPPSVPFSVTLVRYEPAMAMGGRFDFVQIAAGDDNSKEARRVQRIAQACAKKYAKLAAWKACEGARSIIVFEDNDMFLSNAKVIAEALAVAEASRSDCPDEAYVVETYIEPWYVTCLRRPGHSYYDDGERFWEVDPARLTDLTGR